MRMEHGMTQQPVAQSFSCDLGPQSLSREQIQSAAAAPMLRQISKNLSGSCCLAQSQACAHKQFCNEASKPASEADLGPVMHLHHLQQIEQPEPEDILFNPVVSGNWILPHKNLSESVTRL